jgi:hypothetical protein
MYYRIEALQSSYDVRQYNPDDKVVDFTRSRRRGDVIRAAYRFLLAGHWVRIVNDRDGGLVSGPFDPLRGLLRPDKILPYTNDLSESGPSEVERSLFKYIQN